MANVEPEILDNCVTYMKNEAREFLTEIISIKLSVDEMSAADAFDQYFNDATLSESSRLLRMNMLSDKMKYKIDGLNYDPNTLEIIMTDLEVAESNLEEQMDQSARLCNTFKFVATKKDDALFKTELENILTNQVAKLLPELTDTIHSLDQIQRDACYSEQTSATLTEKLIQYPLQRLSTLFNLASTASREENSNLVELTAANAPRVHTYAGYLQSIMDFIKCAREFELDRYFTEYLAVAALVTHAPGFNETLQNLLETTTTTLTLGR